MKKPLSVKRGLISVFGNVILLTLGTGSALGLMELVLRTFPNWVPSEVRVNPPVRRVEAFADETYDVSLSNGDLFYWMRGAIAPLAPDQDRVVAQVHFTTDANGFRNALPEQATYAIVALGDSYTVAGNVASPWPQALADLTGTGVLNLGQQGFGPQEELQVLGQYGLDKQPQWVIMAYFEGNDLYDAAAYDQANPFILARFGRYLFNQGRAALDKSESSDPQAADASRYRYPITVTLQATDRQMAFYSYYIAWLSVSTETLAASQNYRLVNETISQVQAVCESVQAHFLLVYVPSKIHVYLPYVTEAETLERIFTGVPTIELNEAGFLQFSQQRATEALTRQHLNDQAHLLADFAAEENISFLDLTSAFQQEAGTGTELYYPYDTHWNQRGHDLAAQTIATFIQQP